MKNANAAVNIPQTQSGTNTCGPGLVICSNGLPNSNHFLVTPPVNIGPLPQITDVTGSQNIEGTNTCDDTAVGGGLCINFAINPISGGPGNEFILTTDTAAESHIDFSQDVVGENSCLFMSACENIGANEMLVTAQDNQGPLLATDSDVIVESSLQSMGQTNECTGPTGVFGENCVNIGLNQITIAALNDGDVTLGDSAQTGSQTNSCDGLVACTNSGSTLSDGVTINQLVLTSDQPTNQHTKTTLDANTQSATQNNDCTGGPIGTLCQNGASNSAQIHTSTATTQAIADFSENTQTDEQSNTCTDTVVLTTCTNDKLNDFFAVAFDDSTLTGSNVQTGSQENTCSDAGCANLGAQFNIAQSTGTSVVASNSIQNDPQINQCALSACLNQASNDNEAFGSVASTVDSTNEQDVTQTNDNCVTADCENGGLNAGIGSNNFNFVAASDTSDIISSNTQSIEEHNTDCGLALCFNDASNSNVVTTFNDASADSTTEQSVLQNNDCQLADCENTGTGGPGTEASNFNGVFADSTSDVTSSATQSLDQGNTCGGTTCINGAENSNTVDATDSAVVDASTTQSTTQSNDCTNLGSSCVNLADNSMEVHADNSDVVSTDNPQTITESNSCSGLAACSNVMSNSGVIGP